MHRKWSRNDDNTFHTIEYISQHIFDGQRGCGAMVHSYANKPPIPGLAVVFFVSNKTLTRIHLFRFALKHFTTVTSIMEEPQREFSEWPLSLSQLLDTIDHNSNSKSTALRPVELQNLIDDIYNVCTMLMNSTTCSLFFRPYSQERWTTSWPPSSCQRSGPKRASYLRN